MMATLEVPVLIVGGGPVGLSLALLLGQHGVPSLLVERHPGTSIHPKARLVNMRSMEVFRQCGAEQAVRAAGLAPDQARYLLRARTLAGPELDRRPATFTAGARADFSPVSPCSCSQEVLEPVLLAAARQRGVGDVRFDCELVDLAQDDAGVTATLRDAQQGAERRVRARYVVGADGAASRVRELLGIRMEGEAGLFHAMNILFRAELTPWYAGRPFYLCFIENPAAPGTLLTVNAADRWAFQALYRPAAGERPEDFTAARCIDVIRTAVGVADLPVEVIHAAPWTGSALVAARYWEERVFLVGDAAHEMPPQGGFGMNTGIQDAQNLAWKLAAVLGGWAAPALLETYEEERRAVGLATVAQARRNAALVARRAAGAAGTPETSAGDAARPAPALLGEWGLILGAAYASAAVVPDGTPPPAVADPVTEYVPTARPGHRTPHVWLGRDGERLSSLDLFDTAFTLLAGSAGRGWCAAAERVAHSLGVPLRTYTIGAGGDLGDPDGTWGEVYGVERDGAVLVRPDGYVAWRAQEESEDASGALEGALRGVLGLGAAHDEEGDGHSD